MDIAEKIPRGPSLKGPSRPGCLPYRIWVMMQLLAVAFAPLPELACTDLFAGKRALSRAFVGHGEPAVALDILLTPDDESGAL